MSTDRIKQILNSQLSKTYVNNDVYLKIPLNGNEPLLPTNEINKVINLGEQFNKERQGSTYYRVLGNINLNASNVLFNLKNTTLLEKFTWSVFNTNSFLDRSYPRDGDNLDDEDLIYDDAIKNNLKQVNGWFGYYDPDITKSSLCAYYDMEPKRERFYFFSDTNPFNASSNPTPVNNWDLTITYPKYKDDQHNMVKSGLLIVDLQAAVVATRQMSAIGVACKHNLNVGDIVRITGTNGANADFIVIRTGLDNGDLKEYYFVIDKPSTTISISSTSRFKKVVNGVESEYYFRIFEKIATRVSKVIENDDYEVYPAAFSENYYRDNISQFVFNEDINVSGLTDNLGRPLSEIYLTIIKRDSNSLFSSVSSGIEVPFIAKLNTSNTNTYLKTIPVISKIHNGGNLPFPSHTPLETNIKINSVSNVANKNQYYGDLVEYNKNELIENVLAVVCHRFNTVNRESTNSTMTYATTKTTPQITKTTTLGPRQEGYYYQPHHKYQIREFSSYIEEADSATLDIPSYAETFDNVTYLWRDLLDIGFNESNVEPLDYPFLNGCHYLFENICFEVKRQDPFANWKLYYNIYPADPIGTSLSDNYVVKTSNDNVC
jgi:hypothetical protein